MLRLAGLMVTIGLADSVNPSTIAPALYLASGPRARIRVAEFTLSVFLVYLLGGVLIALGPGQLLRQILPHPDYEDRAVAEMVAGAILIVASVLMWRRREHLQDLKLPTAFPYFAAIAAVVGSRLGLARQLGLLLLFNVCFVLPLIGIVLTLVFAGHRADRYMRLGREFIERRWPHVLAVLLAVVGVLALLLGATGFAATKHGRVARFLRHVRHVLHLSH